MPCSREGPTDIVRRTDFTDAKYAVVRIKSPQDANESDLDLVLSVREALPEDTKLVVIIDAYQPMVFSELEPACDVILINWVGSSDSRTKTFAVTDETFARVVAGEVEPTGLLTFQMPKDMDTVEAQQEDVPRDMDCYVDSEGNTYDFCYGLNWSGVIDDERVTTYKVAPISEPETEVKASE